MSLETKIDQLNATLLKLIDVLQTPVEKEQQKQAQETPAPVESVQEQKEETVEPQVNQITHKDVQDKVLQLVREDMDKKKKIKALLKDEFGKSKVSDLEDSQLEECAKKLEQL